MAIIGLLTDFGTRDPYVAAMKGVLASRTTATVIDLSHEIAPFDVFEASMFLRFVLRQFDSGSAAGRVVVVAVVDPGVGSARRILCAEDDGRMLLAPDNGLLSPLLGPGAEIRQVSNRALFLSDVSRTFHGRDIFAPVAAAIAEGLPLDKVGPRVDSGAIVRLPYSPPERDGARLTGTVIAIDRFGNVITDIEWHDVVRRTPVRARVGGKEITLVRESYSGAPEGTPFLICGSRDSIEISVANGSAAALLQIERLDRVTIEPLRVESSSQ